MQFFLQREIFLFLKKFRSSVKNIFSKKSAGHLRKIAASTVCLKLQISVKYVIIYP